MEVHSFLSLPAPRRWQQTSEQIKTKVRGKGWWSMYIVDGFAWGLGGLLFLLGASEGNWGAALGGLLGALIITLPFIFFMHRTRKKYLTLYLEGQLLPATVVGVELSIYRDGKVEIPRQQLRLEFTNPQQQRVSFQCLRSLAPQLERAPAQMGATVEVLYHPKYPNFIMALVDEELHPSQG